jgi:hypothetical protein
LSEPVSAPRGTIFGSRDVNRLFNRLDGMMGRASLFRPRHEGDRMVTRVQVGGAFDELQGAIRRELGADTIALTGRTARAEAP